jgi:tRNA pseudouridine55 synthase
MGKQKKGRDISGILLLDKPLGLSSNQALQKVKKLYQAQKAGHTGSLDPLATGVLPICFGEATKFSQYLLNADKVYLTRIKLGEKTATGDSEGEIIEKRPVDFMFESLVEILSQFTGEQTQIPSMYSAIKQNGQPLYKLARQGIEVEREPRAIVVSELRLVSERSLFEEKQEFELYVHCSKGTYIRNLGEDIGEAAGCGAHLRSLRRLKAGQFDEMHTLSSLELHRDTYEKLDDFLLPVDAVSQNYA